MSFDRLHPALQYHIVNSIGWPGLREVQERCIAPIMAGQNIIVQAATAGGKTEASFFPLMSEMLIHDWQPISILYLSPLRALLNNQEQRLRAYFEMVGHRAAVWHGDTGQGARKALRDDPPSCLLTTPESIEGMLVSKRTNHQRMFAHLRAVVIDEVHAFAGDDRGWHLQAILARLSHLAGRPLQRIGLSATVGNPEYLAQWLNAGAEAPHPVVKPTQMATVKPEVQLDYVGSLSNAAKVISALYRGEKRLVFTDSRARCEELGALLREHHVRTFVTHSSLSRDMRQQTEDAFADEKNCVIVATSALELGIDIGDLDRVIQIDAPSTVASFLQRMGRTGRRKGTLPNCLFLATDPDRLVAAAALIQLWESGYVEPVIPPGQPVHLLAQQIMALMLQEGGIPQAGTTIETWLDACPDLRLLYQTHGPAIIAHMAEQGLIAANDGLLWFAERGEQTFGKKNFLELLSVFTSAPLLTVLHGRHQIASLDQLTFWLDNDRAIKDGRPTILTLAGRHWVVTDVNYRQRTVAVIPSQDRGRARWMGSAADISHPLAQAHLQVLTSDGQSPRWSRRAQEALASQRDRYQWLCNDALILTRDGASCELWTFAGTAMNRLISQAWDSPGANAACDAFAVTWTSTATSEALAEELHDILQQIRDGRRSFVPPPQLLQEIKFHEAVPTPLLTTMLSQRLAPDAHLRLPERFIVRNKTSSTC
ncbi:MAG: DEAD/DEAH box helicase [Planctomycetota bacterium]|nr:MAG: DEAD/DEAH box helicase [Planctomycetota bacterium]